MKIHLVYFLHENKRQKERHLIRLHAVPGPKWVWQLSSSVFFFFLNLFKRKLALILELLKSCFLVSILRSGIAVLIICACSQISNTTVNCFSRTTTRKKKKKKKPFLPLPQRTLWWLPALPLRSHLLRPKSRSSHLHRGPCLELWDIPPSAYTAICRHST